MNESSQTLHIGAEPLETSDRRSNQFTARCVFFTAKKKKKLFSFVFSDIEEMSQKTGSFKKFEIFVKMLFTAFEKKKFYSRKK